MLERKKKDVYIVTESKASHLNFQNHAYMITCLISADMTQKPIHSFEFLDFTSLWS